MPSTVLHWSSRPRRSPGTSIALIGGARKEAATGTTRRTWTWRAGSAQPSCATSPSRRSSSMSRRRAALPPAGSRISLRGRGGRHRTLRERPLPGRQGAQRPIPALDLAIRLEREASRLRKVHRRPDGKIRNRKPLAGDEFPAPQLTVQNLCRPIERLHALGDRRRVGIAALDNVWFDQILEDEHRARRVPMGNVPELPTRDIETLPFACAQKPALRFLAREILRNRARFPQHVVAVLEHRHSRVWIERGEFGSLLLALEQVDDVQRGVDAEMVCDRHDPERARRRRKYIQLDGHSLLLLWNR